MKLLIILTFNLFTYAAYSFSELHCGLYLAQSLNGPALINRHLISMTESRGHTLDKTDMRFVHFNTKLEKNGMLTFSVKIDAENAQWKDSVFLGKFLKRTNTETLFRHKLSKKGSNKPPTIVCLKN